MCIFFQIWAWLLRFLLLFPEAPVSSDKKIWNNFCCIVLLFVWTQKVSQTFKILFQAGNVNIVLRGVFLVDMFHWKAPFLLKKISAVKSETHFSRVAIKVYRSKTVKENFIIDRSWSSAKLLTMLNYTDKANGDLSLTVENV